MFSKRFIIFQCVFFLAAVLLIGLRYMQPKPLPVFGHVQDFQLINTNNQTVGLKDLAGKVWAVDFMFTSCGNICPTLTANMNKIHKAFKHDDRLRLVSISVNPENDTPQVLTKYAEKFNANTHSWWFLTGSREDITKVAVESFKVGDVKEPIFHSPYFMLVDRNANIRGYYDGTEAKNIKLIERDLRRLLNE